MGKKKSEITIRSSAAEYLTFVAASGNDEQSIEMRYENENIWLTQKMMAELYDVTIPAINQHIKNIFNDDELSSDAVIKEYLITAADGKKYNTKQTEFEKYRTVQDKLFQSDFDRFLDTFAQGGGRYSINYGFYNR